MPMLRLAVGVAAMSVLAGFFLFQGLFWAAWWVLLLGFVPWHWFETRTPRAPRPVFTSASRAQLLCIVALAAQQVVMSAAFTELPPVSSRYDMYSKTHASPADYERENPGVGRRLLAEDADGVRTDVSSCAPQLTDASRLASALPEALAGCGTHAKPPVRYVLLEDRCSFDWNVGRFGCAYRDKLIATYRASE
jgi:hypothetical protein